MERPLEDGDESPDSQGHATDWRFAVCSFRDAWEEEEPASQMHIKDPGPPRPPTGAAQDEGLQDSPLSRKLQLLLAADELGDPQRGKVESSSVLSEGPGPSGVESLLCPMSSHLNLAQGEGDTPGVGLVVDPGPSRVMPSGLSPGGLDSNSVGLGDPLSEKSSKLLEAGKEGWAREVWEGNRDAWRNECQDLGGL